MPATKEVLVNKAWFLSSGNSGDRRVITIQCGSVAGGGNTVCKQGEGHLIRTGGSGKVIRAVAKKVPEIRGRKSLDTCEYVMTHCVSGRTLASVRERNICF